MLKKIINGGTLFCLIVLLSGCTEMLIEPSETNTNPPGLVTNVRVTNLPGKALIQYSLPTDPDLLYVKAVYTLPTGQAMEVKSSYYNNSLTVEGFADTVNYTVQLFAVNRSETSSAPVDVTIKPKENPIWKVYRSLEALASFGGIRITALNETRADLTIQVMVDSLGEWVPSIDNIYTSTSRVNQNIRGLDTVPETFAITIRDRWLNYTDTLVTTLTPLYEAALPKSAYRAVVLPTDVGQQYTSTALSNMWDGQVEVWPQISLTVTGQLTPQWVTFDVGRLAKLSRIVIWDYPEYTNSGRMFYQGGNMKNFEIWGSDNPPSDGSFTNWHKLGQYEQIKPSGTPVGQQTTEDSQLAAAGFSWDFDISVPKCRYVRIVCNKNWSGTTFMAIGEVQVYGDPR